MPSATARGLRYPLAADSPDVPRDIGNLAADVDAMWISVATDATLPAFGKVGREAYSVGSGVTWLDIGTAWVRKGVPGDGTVTRQKMAAFPRVRLSHPSNITVANNTSTKIPFGSTDVEVYDTDNFHDPTTNNTRITIPYTGIYSCGAYSEMSPSDEPAFSWKMGSIFINGVISNVVAGLLIPLPSPNLQGLGIFGEALLNAGDYIEYRVMHTAGSSEFVFNSFFYAHFKGA